MNGIMAPLTSALPLLAAALVSWLMVLWRNHVAPVIPDKWVPILLPVAGGITAALARVAGVDIGDFNAETADLSAWQTVIAGVLTGFAANGLHQAQKQLRKPPD